MMYRIEDQQESQVQKVLCLEVGKRCGSHSCDMVYEGYVLKKEGLGVSPL